MFEKREKFEMADNCRANVANADKSGFPICYEWLTRPGLTFDKSKPKSVPNLMMGQGITSFVMVLSYFSDGYLKMTSKQNPLGRRKSISQKRCIQFRMQPGSVSHSY